MRGLLAALALVPAGARAQDWMRPVGARPYGVLVLGYGVSAAWRAPMEDLRRRLKTIPLEAVDAEFQGSVDGLAIQRAVDKLVAQGAAKIVAVPLETVASSPLLEETRYLFGQRANPVSNRPVAAAPKPGPRPLRPSMLVLPRRGGPRRLKSPVPLVLADPVAEAPVVTDILAARAKALSRAPARDAVVLAGLAPLSDAAMRDWLSAASAAAEKVRAAAGFREAAAVVLRDGARANQREHDAQALAKTLRRLGARGGVAVVPLSADGAWTGQLLRKELPDALYRWNGRGLLGDARLLDWIQAAAAAASALPDGRRYRDEAALKTPLGGMR